MKRLSIEEQMQAAKKEVETWPQWVKDATEFRCSSPYYGEPPCSGHEVTEHRESRVAGERKNQY